MPSLLANVTPKDSIELKANISRNYTPKGNF